MNDAFTLRDHGVIALHNLVANFADSPNLPFGISYLIVTKDNEATITESLSSILETADQIVVVDGSLGKETQDIIADFASVEKLKYIRYRNGEKNWKAFTDSLNYGLNHCGFRWVFKWDADMVADPEGLQHWKKRLANLSSKYFYEVDVARVNSSKTIKFGDYEGRLFTQHPKIKYCWVPDRDSIVYPFWFKLLRWNEQYILHKEPK